MERVFDTLVELVSCLCVLYPELLLWSLKRLLVESCLLNLEDDILLETDSPLDKTVTPPLYPPKLCDLKTGGLSDLGWSVSLLSNDSTLGNLPGLNL